MPASYTQKSIAYYTTFTCNYSKGGFLKRLTVSKETEAQFKNTGKTCWVKIPKEKKVVIYLGDSEVCIEANADIAHLDLLSRITITKYCKELKS